MFDNTERGELDERGEVPCHKAGEHDAKKDNRWVKAVPKPPVHVRSSTRNYMGNAPLMDYFFEFGVPPSDFVTAVEDTLERRFRTGVAVVVHILVWPPPWGAEIGPGPSASAS